MSNSNTTLVTVEGQSLSEEEARGRIAQLLARQEIPAETHAQVLAKHGPQLLQQVIEQFIDQVLLKKEVERRNIQIEDGVVDAALKRMTDSLPEGVSLDKALEAEDISMDALREDIAHNEKLRILYETVTAKAPSVTDDDVSEFYTKNEKQFVTNEEVSASHILVNCPEDAEESRHEAANKKAEEVRSKLDAGADFAELAGEYSDCPSKERGGVLGSFARGRMVPEFEEAAFSQDLDTIGPVTKTKFGYHIIKVTDRRAAEKKSLEDMDANIREHLASSAKQGVFQLFLESLREDADINITADS